MDDAEVAEVLALVAALDPWSLEVDDTIVDAWTLALPDVDGNHAKRAVIEHYRESSKRISIADVITRSRDIEIRDRAALRHEALRQRRETDHAALPAPAPRRDRTQDIAGLLARHRNWSLVGDLSVRRRQASWSPALEQAYRRAVAAKVAAERESGQDDGAPE